VVKEQEEVKNRERIDEGEENQVRNRGGSSVGVYILLFLVVIVIVLYIIDRFVLEGKIFDSLFGPSKPEDQSEVTEQKLELRGFQGRSLDTL
jgi:hypothetical protein